MTRLALNNKPRWFLHINLLKKITMEKSIFYIKMTKRPMFDGNHGKKEKTEAILATGEKVSP